MDRPVPGFVGSAERAIVHRAGKLESLAFPPVRAFFRPSIQGPSVSRALRFPRPKRWRVEPRGLQEVWRPSRPGRGRPAHEAGLPLTPSAAHRANLAHQQRGAMTSDAPLALAVTGCDACRAPTVTPADPSRAPGAVVLARSQLPDRDTRLVSVQLAGRCHPSRLTTRISMMPHADDIIAVCHADGSNACLTSICNVRARGHERPMRMPIALSRHCHQMVSTWTSEQRFLLASPSIGL